MLEKRGRYGYAYTNNHTHGQAVISPSALSLMYPAEGIPDYSREQFIDDLLSEHETEIRRCLKKGAHKVQWISPKDGWL